MSFLFGFSLVLIAGFFQGTFILPIWIPMNRSPLAAIRTGQVLTAAWI